MVQLEQVCTLGENGRGLKNEPPTFAKIAVKRGRVVSARGGKAGRLSLMGGNGCPRSDSLTKSQNQCVH